MSASLVGSEMCIRDRFRAQATSEDATKLQAFEARTACAQEQPQECSPKPVSYTHLTLPTICSV
eukprot:14834661-Alexandrium_andersonii.AAC.1